MHAQIDPHRIFADRTLASILIDQFWTLERAEECRPHNPAIRALRGQAQLDVCNFVGLMAPVSPIGWGKMRPL